MATIDLAPTRRRQALGSAAVVFAALPSLMALAGAVWVVARLVPGHDVDAVAWRLVAVSIGIAAVLVAVNRFLAWAAWEFEVRVSERLVTSGSVFRDMFPAVVRSAPLSWA